MIKGAIVGILSAMIINTSLVYLGIITDPITSLMSGMFLGFVLTIAGMIIDT